MRRWLPPIVVLGVVFALAPAVHAVRAVKANAAGNTSVGSHFGRLGMASGIDSPLTMDAPSLDVGSGLVTLGPAIEDTNKPGLKARAYAREVQGRENVTAAAQFLEDDETRSWLREKAPQRHRELFSKATGLNDLRLTLQTYEDPHMLRLALLARSNIEQAKTPQSMLAWIDSDPSLAHFRDRVAAAYWEWQTLDEQQRSALAHANVTQEQWAGVSMDTRRSFLRSAGRRLLSAARVGYVPRSVEEVKLQRRALLSAWGAFDNNERFQWNDKFAKGIFAHDKLVGARQALAKLFNPNLRKALDRAEEQTDPQATLELLQTIFDGVGESKQSRQIAKVADARPDQQFTPMNRQVLAQFLRTHMINEVAGTQAGDMLGEFFKGRPMQIVVKPMKEASFARYAPKLNRIEFNERMVTEFMRGRDLSIAQLFSDMNALEDLMALLAPAFVHEATHQTQFQALVDIGVPPGTKHWYDTTLEVEAFTRQTLYVHEMVRGSERHRLLFIEGQNLLGATRSDVKRAQMLRDDPAAFKAHVLGGYAQVKTLSGMAHARLNRRSESDIHSDRAARRILGAELAVRRRLSASERAQRERVGLDLREWSNQGSTPVNKIKTSALRGALRYKDPEQGWIYDVYDYLRERYATSIRGAMIRLHELYPDTMSGTIATSRNAAADKKN
ncbi:MAG: hypothetical protein COB53_05160 [Elusimicrobia bacterium]|nr:MAG: hypothetical protein COB53_05160 [Elusimicrobiota bacterium]